MNNILNLKFLKRDDVLNIFTDASISANNIEKFIGSYGIYVPIINKCYYGIDRYTTNNRSELKGIIMALEYAVANRSNYNIINIFSDSLICVKSINEWIHGWCKNSIDGVLFSSTGEVKNQDLLFIIVHLILDNNLKINVFHVKGHVYNEYKLNSIMSLFYQENRIMIERDTLKYLCSCNNVIDEYTRKQLQTEFQFTPFLSIPILYKFYNLDMKRYSYLTNKNNII